MRKLAALSTLVVLALAGASLAIAAGPGKKAGTKTTKTTTTTGVTRTPETPLTGDTLTKAEAAAVAKVGGTANSATTENDSSLAGAAYEVHMTKADGTHVTLVEDSSFAVLGVETGGPLGGPGGPHGAGHPGNGETPLTGDTATKAKAAALAKVGGTADSATTETDSSDATAAYEVHVTKADGTHVTVIEDKSFAVLTVESGGPGGPHGGPHAGHRR
jgi:uncharacterized membrane protein YkoI